MSEDLMALISLVESSQQDNNEFGTSFAIHRGEQATYFLTCAHVVDTVGRGYAQIDGVKANVIAVGTADSLDFAVLEVEGHSTQPLLKLMVTGEEGDAITIVGFHNFGKHRLGKPIRGHLGTPSSLRKPKTQGGWIKVWDLKMETDHYLQPGYSGSPVIHANSGKVIGVVNYRRGQGDRGLAISIEALAELWQASVSLRILEFDFASQDTAQSEAAQSKMKSTYATMERERLEKQIINIQQNLEILSGKIQKLEQDRFHETRREEINRLGRVIGMAKEQRAQMEQELVHLTLSQNLLMPE